MFPDLQIWLNHFEYHSESHRRMPQALPGVLTPDEHRLIADSIATFQLGEQSEGATLLRAAQRYEKTHDAAPLAAITALFIREEQHHAALLSAFMDEHGIAHKRRDWTDHIFRGVRRLAGYETCLSVLVTAELIGNVYYRALEAATGCRPLQMLCRVLVADELAHIAFESDLLIAIRADKPAPFRFVAGLAHRGFFACTALVVWLTHRAVLRRAGYRMRTFLRACNAQYSFYLGSPRLAHDSPQYP